MLQKTAIQSLSDLLAANERLKSTAETHYCFLKDALNIPSDVMRFPIATNKHLKWPGSCFDEDKHFMRRMQPFRLPVSQSRVPYIINYNLLHIQHPEMI